MPIQFKQKCEKEGCEEQSCGCECLEVTDPYSFRVSVVLPAWSRRFRDINFRNFVETTIRSEAPAHTYLKLCWVSHEGMRAFEDCLCEWEEELAVLGKAVTGVGHMSGSLTDKDGNEQAIYSLETADGSKMEIALCGTKSDEPALRQVPETKLLED